MAELKTRPGDGSVDAFIDAIEEPGRREDCRAVLELMRRATGEAPRMWGGSIVGFGEYHYEYETGREGDWFVVGFSPRKRELTLYIMAGFDRYAELMGRLGKHRTGKSCLYIKRLSDVDTGVLDELIRSSVEHVRKTAA